MTKNFPSSSLVNSASADMSGTAADGVTGLVGCAVASLLGCSVAALFRCAASGPIAVACSAFQFASAVVMAAAATIVTVAAVVAVPTLPFPIPPAGRILWQSNRGDDPKTPFDPKPLQNILAAREFGMIRYIPAWPLLTWWGTWGVLTVASSHAINEHVGVEPVNQLSFVPPFVPFVEHHVDGQVLGVECRGTILPFAFALAPPPPVKTHILPSGVSGVWVRQLPISRRIVARVSPGDGSDGH